MSNETENMAIMEEILKRAAANDASLYATMRWWGWLVRQEQASQA